VKSATSRAIGDESVDASANSSRGPPMSENDHRQAGGLRFDDDVAEVSVVLGKTKVSDRGIGLGRAVPVR